MVYGVLLDVIYPLIGRLVYLELRNLTQFLHYDLIASSMILRAAMTRPSLNRRETTMSENGCTCKDLEIGNCGMPTIRH
jgi:hypothetical protein